MSNYDIYRDKTLGTIEVRDKLDLLFSLQPENMKNEPIRLYPMAKMKSRKVEIPLEDTIEQVKAKLKSVVQTYIQDLQKLVTELWTKQQNNEQKGEKMKILRFLRRLFEFNNLPIWAYGLECDICRMSFIKPEYHLKYAKQKRLINKHKGKIPKIMRWKMQIEFIRDALILIGVPIIRNI